MEKFQKFFGLPVTGKLDDETLNEMKKPRCGLPDLGNNGERLRMKRYSTWSRKWSKRNLKYYMTYGEDMSHADQSRVMAKAFKMWSDVTRLSFSRTYRISEADFRIRFCFLPYYLVKLIPLFMLNNAL